MCKEYKKIDFQSDYDNFKITGITYCKKFNNESKKDLKLEIKVNSSYVICKKSKGDGTDFKSTIIVPEEKKQVNSGIIIENYRIKLKECKQYIENNKDLFNKERYTVNKKFGQSFDYVQIMYPRDTFLKNILEEFAKIQFDGQKDYSSSFVKKENKSILDAKCDEEKKEQFIFTKPANLKKPLERILFIDDTIDEGNTLGIFLDYLADNELINEKTKIFVCIIYNSPKKNDIKEKINNRLKNMGKK